jgi:hypothetical protein
MTNGTRDAELNPRLDIVGLILVSAGITASFACAAEELAVLDRWALYGLVHSAKKH